MTDRALTRGEDAAARDCCPHCGQQMPAKRSPLTIHAIIKAANDLAGMDVRCSSRKRPLVRIRWAAWRAARQFCEATYPEIGFHFRVDHSSVMHGEKRADASMVQLVADIALGKRSVVSLASVPAPPPPIVRPTAVSASRTVAWRGCVVPPVTGNVTALLMGDPPVHRTAHRKEVSA